MKISELVRNYGGFALGHFQESAAKQNDQATLDFIQLYGSDLVQGLADALEKKESREDLIDRARFVAHEACALMHHLDITPDEAVNKALEVMHLAELAVEKHLNHVTR
jgi:hypothetical protein